MTAVRLTLASTLALVLIWAGAGEATASSQPAHAASVSAVSKGLGALKPAQRKARRQALGKCRTVRLKAKRKRCLKRVKAKYRRIAKRQSVNKPTPPKPVAPTAVHDVLVTDNGCDTIQSSCFLPIRDGVPDTWGGPGNPASNLEIKAGEAVRFVWDENPRDSAHQITLWGDNHPAGVDPRNFEMSGSATEGVTFQRTFTVPGVYQFRCSLHQETQILNLTVIP